MKAKQTSCNYLWIIESFCWAEPNLQQRRLLGDTSSLNCSTYVSHVGNSLKVLRTKHVSMLKESPLSYGPVKLTFLLAGLHCFPHSDVGKQWQLWIDFPGLLWRLLFLHFALFLLLTQNSAFHSSLSFPSICSVSPSLRLIESAFLLHVTCDPKHLLVHTIYATMPHKVISPDFSKDSTSFS